MSMVDKVFWTEFRYCVNCLKTATKKENACLRCKGTIFKEMIFAQASSSVPSSNLKNCLSAPNGYGG
jgi:hypothetical protein